MICPWNLKARGVRVWVFLSHAGEGILIREKPRGLQGREGHFFSLPQGAPPAVIHAQSTAGVLSCPPLKCPGRHQHTFTCEHIFKGLSWPMDLKKKKKRILTSHVSTPLYTPLKSLWCLILPLSLLLFWKRIQSLTILSIQPLGYSDWSRNKPVRALFCLFFCWS